MSNITKELDSHQELQRKLDKSIATNAKLVENNIKLKDSNRELLEALETIRDSFWSDGESYHEMNIDLKSIASEALTKAKNLNS